MQTSTVASDARWLTPVFVQLGYDLAEPVRSAKEAMNYLHFRWPMRRGRAFDTARTLCAVAVERNLACEDAREAFIRACIESSILD